MFFGVKPDLMLKCGTIAAAAMGAPTASLPTPPPVQYRPMFGALGRSLQQSRVTCVSQAAAEAGVADQLELESLVLPGKDIRQIGKADMIHNNAMPDMSVDPETYEVRADGELLTCEPATELPMAQRYFLF